MKSRFNLDEFIARHVTGRTESLFMQDFQEHISELEREIQGRSVCVIGGA